MHPIFGESNAIDVPTNTKFIPGKKPAAASENSTGSATPNIPSLPYFPVIIPGEDTASSNPVPADVLETDTHRSNILPSQSGSDTSDPPPEAEPDPEGIVQQYLLQTMNDIRDNQLPLHKSPDCYRLHKTFWIRPPDRWFALQEYKAQAEDLSPNKLYHPDIFVWLPGSLMPGSFKFRCIFCTSDYMSDYGTL
jgi:hypothetical protein